MNKLNKNGTIWDSRKTPEVTSKSLEQKFLYIAHDFFLDIKETNLKKNGFESLDNVI